MATVAIAATAEAMVAATDMAAAGGIAGNHQCASVIETHASTS
jgi:hypothetical protein